MAEIDCRPQASFPRCSSESLHALSVLFFKAFIIGLCPLPSLKWRALAEESCKTDVSVVLGLYSESRASLSAGPRGWAELATFSDSLKNNQSQNLMYTTRQRSHESLDQVFPVLRNRAAPSSLRNITSSSRLPQCSPSFSAALPGCFSFSPLRYCRPRCNAALPGCCSFSPLRYCRPRCNAALPGCRRRPDRRPRASGWICGLSSSCILMMCS